MKKYIKFPNGLRVVVNTMKHTQSVTVGVFIGIGSAYETEKEHGLSHFIEHMCFRGTKTRTGKEIAEEIESIGAQINAFTSKEMTAYYTTAQCVHLDVCLEILSDIFFNPSFTDENIEKEKKVVIEEINSSEDTPQDLCHDLLGESFFGHTGIGRTILGTKANVSSFTRSDIVSYMDRYYIPENTVISIAGNVDCSEVEKLSEKYFASQFTIRESKVEKYCIPPIKESRLLSAIKPLEQSNIAFGFQSDAYRSKRRIPIAILSEVLGVGMSSRLFQSVREELGLVYDIYSMSLEYDNDGVFIIALATSADSAVEATNAIRNVIEELKRDGITEKELIRGREQFKTGLIFGYESSKTIMKVAGIKEIIYSKKFNFKDELKLISNVTIDEVNESIAHLFDFDKVAAAYVGPKLDEDVDLLKIFKTGQKEESNINV
ncbi:MAG: insulinase family protein [Christensenellaceae bacterium]|nr:insulinase family protein [Christensenellaceae bacterium]